MNKKNCRSSLVQQILTCSRGVSFVGGLVLLWSANYTHLLANITGQGSTVFHWMGTEEPTLTQGSFHTAAFIEETQTDGTGLMIGILLIVLGFLIHTLLIVQKEKPVHVTVKSPKKTSRRNVIRE